jgi:RsiW-degrading membrane proteinase PrsW (M82 family)
MRFIDPTSTLPPLSSPLNRKPVARAVATLLAVLLAFAALVICLIVGGPGSKAAQVFLNALAMSSLLSLLPLAILWFLDRRERESPRLFAAAFLWGGLIATSISLPFNTAIIYAVSQWLDRNTALREMLGPDAALLIGAPLAAPIIEELAKGAGIALLFWLARCDFDNARDGFVYGALVGAGFNWFESALYVQQNYLELGFAPYGLQLGARYAWLGMAGHAMFSGIFGASLGVARATRRPAVRLLSPFVGLALAMLAHAWQNSLPLFLALIGARQGEAPPAEPAAPPDLGVLEVMWSASISNLIVFLPYAVLLLAILRRSGRAERTVIREELASEVGGSITEQEYRDVVGDRAFRTRRVVGRHREVSAALVNAQHELAFRKRRLRDRGYDPERDPLVAARRTQIQALRSRLG